MGEPRHVDSRIPVFISIEEEAEFWDTHDSTEFEDEWEPVDVEISPTVRSRFFLHAEVDHATLRRVRELARTQGLTANELARCWVLDAFARATAGPDRASDEETRDG